MPDPVQPPANPPATPPQELPVNNDAFPASWEDVFKHPRFKELNTRAQTAETELKKLQDAEKAKADSALVEQNKWKELYEGTQKDLAKEKANNLRLKVASSKGLPGELVDRLRGETEEDLVRDADALLAFLKPAGSKGVPPPTNGGTTSKIDFLTETDPAKIREALRKGQQ